MLVSGHVHSSHPKFFPGTQVRDWAGRQWNPLDCHQSPKFPVRQGVSWRGSVESGPRSLTCRERMNMR